MSTFFLSYDGISFEPLTPYELDEVNEQASAPGVTKTELSDKVTRFDFDGQTVWLIESSDHVGGAKRAYQSAIHHA